MSKDLKDLTRAELERVELRADRVVSRYVDEMIAAGRGRETPSQTQGRTDPLSKLYIAAMDVSAAVAQEKRRRMEYEREYANAVVYAGVQIWASMQAHAGDPRYEYRNGISTLLEELTR